MLLTSFTNNYFTDSNPRNTDAGIRAGGQECGFYDYDWRDESLITLDSSVSNFTNVVANMTGAVKTFMDATEFTHSITSGTSVNLVEIVKVGTSGSYITYNFKFYI